MLNPNNDKAFFGRGYVKHKLEDYRGAILDYNSVIELSPSDAITFVYRGLAKINLGYIDSGCLDFSKAGELGDEEAYDLIKELCR